MGYWGRRRGGQGCLLCPHLLELQLQEGGVGGVVYLPPTPPPPPAVLWVEGKLRQRGWHRSSKVTPSQQHSPALLPRGHCPPPQPKQGQLPPSLLHSLLDLGQEGAQDPSPQLTWMMQEERRPGLRRGGAGGGGGMLRAGCPW